MWLSRIKICLYILSSFMALHFFCFSLQKSQVFCGEFISRFVGVFFIFRILENELSWSYYLMRFYNLNTSCWFCVYICPSYSYSFLSNNFSIKLHGIFQGTIVQSVNNENSFSLFSTTVVVICVSWLYHSY